MLQELGISEETINFLHEEESKIKDIFSKVGTFIKGIVDGIHGAFKKLKKAIKGIIDTVIGWIEGLIEKVQGAFDKVGGIAKNIKKTVGGAFDKVSNLIPNNIFSIQAHATGGITNGPSIGLIGEQGKEAVLPLERGNTLQMLGNAILNSATVNKTQQSRSSKIDINISGFNKEFYTKAEVKNIANGIADILVQGGYSLT
jgi:archaellum component FlaC